MKKENWTILPILLDWSKGGSEEGESIAPDSTGCLLTIAETATAKEARHLLSCTIDEAAIYLDKHLPSPPNPRGLTGYVEIPPSPSKVSSEAPSEVPVLPQSASTSRTSVAKTSFSPKIPSTAQNRPASSETLPRLAASKQSRTDPTATALPQPQTPKSLPFIPNLLPFLWPNLSLPFPSPHPSLPPKPAVPEIPPQTKLSCATAPLPSKPQLICPSLPPKPEITLSYSVLTLSGIPSTSQQTDIEQLFKSAGIKAQVLFISSNYRPTLSIVRIPTDQASLCVQILEGSFFMGSKISCIGGPTKASLTVEPDTPSESSQLPSSPNRAPSTRPRRSRSRSRSPLRYDPSICHGKYRRRSSQEHSKANRQHRNPSTGGRRRWQHSWD